MNNYRPMMIANQIAAKPFQKQTKLENETKPFKTVNTIKFIFTTIFTTNDYDYDMMEANKTKTKKNIKK